MLNEEELDTKETSVETIIPKQKERFRRKQWYVVSTYTGRENKSLNLLKDVVLI